MESDLSIIPLWLQLAYTGFLLVLVAVYWKKYGLGNFLWFSDIALFSVSIVLWTGNKLLFSIMAVGVLALELVWNLDYFGRLLTGRQLLGLNAYMFDKSKSIFLRGLSLFHVVLPVLVIWLLLSRATSLRRCCWQAALAWVVVPLTYFLTDPKENINWVFGQGNEPQHKIPARLYFAMMMLIFPVGVYLPSHFLLQWLFN